VAGLIRVGDAVRSDFRDVVGSPSLPLFDPAAGLAQWPYDAWTAHDDEFSSRDRSLAVAEQPAERKESPMSSSVVNFIAIIVRRFCPMSLKPC
jgi:hypothetical protein